MTDTRSMEAAKVIVGQLGDLMALDRDTAIGVVEYIVRRHSEVFVAREYELSVILGRDGSPGSNNDAMDPNYVLVTVRTGNPDHDLHERVAVFIRRVAADGLTLGQEAP